MPPRHTIHGNRFSFLGFRSALTIVIVSLLIEAAATHWLWNFATADDFNVYASVNQVRARYGDEIFVFEQGRDTRSHSPHHYLGYVPAPNFQRGDNKHNHLGFRGDEISAEKPANTYRIVAVGGSTTYSVHVEDYRDSYPDLLNDYLRGAGFDFVEVINAGVAGYSSYDNLINISFRVLSLEPDLIIIHQGFNDIDERFVYPFSRYLGDNSGALAAAISDRVMPEIWEYSTYLRILGIRAGYIQSHADLDLHGNRRAQSNYEREFKRQVNRGTYPSGIFTEVSADKMLAANPPVYFQRNLATILGIIESHNVDALLVTMVLSRDFHARTGSSKSKFYSHEVFQAAMAQHNDITRRIAESTETPLFDLAIEFPDEPSLLTDGLHMNIDGNRVRAQLIGDFVIREFLS